MPMPCPKCGGTTNVRDVRDYPQAVYRRRRCSFCQHKFTTWEHAEDSDHSLSLSAQRARLRRVAQLILDSVGKEDKK